MIRTKQSKVLTITLTVTVAALVVFIAKEVKAGSWNGKNDPENMEKETLGEFGAYKYNYDSLPKSGRLSKQPWACSFWPTRKQGAAARWHGDVNPVHGKESGFTLSELRSLSARDMANLSPTEKYDIARCDYNYTLTGEEKDRTANYQSASAWAGLCHGWAPAALNYDEPDCANIKNRDGVTIPFYSADIKALLSLMQGVYHEEEDSYQVGTKNIGINFFSNGNDVNPGALHVILANRIGRFDKGFCGEMDPGMEIWNHPIEGFQTEELKRSRDSVVVRTTIIYPDDEPKLATERALNNGRGDESFRNKEVLEYKLDLDRNGNITGGSYISGVKPDFLWSASRAPFKGIFKELAPIYEKSIK
ncbi:MAG: hypothetical protein HQK50_13155 [Oligoflexia bacterium]|nr:hypothetical protein [Oligoflexia bacterium]MBF0366514.1 hypothetical protein [Oligoflexia bacterium]